MYYVIICTLLRAGVCLLEGRTSYSYVCTASVLAFLETTTSVSYTFSPQPLLSTLNSPKSGRAQCQTPFLSIPIRINLVSAPRMSSLFRPCAACSPLLHLLCSNGRQAVGDGAYSVDAVNDVLAVCQVQGSDDIYYYSYVSIARACRGSVPDVHERSFP